MPTGIYNRALSKRTLRHALTYLVRFVARFEPTSTVFFGVIPRLNIAVESAWGSQNTPRPQLPYVNARIAAKSLSDWPAGKAIAHFALLTVLRLAVGSGRKVARSCAN